METRQGKIEEKFLKFAANKAAYATFKIDGKNYNTFDKEIIDAHNPDDFVEFTGEQEGRFWTLKTMKKIKVEESGEEGHVFVPPKNGAKEYHLSPEEVKCRALECANAFFKMQGDAFSSDDVLDMANKFVEWIRNGN